MSLLITAPLMSSIIGGSSGTGSLNTNTFSWVFPFSQFTGTVRFRLTGLITLYSAGPWTASYNFASVVDPITDPYSMGTVYGTIGPFTAADDGKWFVGAWSTPITVPSVDKVCNFFVDQDVAYAAYLNHVRIEYEFINMTAQPSYVVLPANVGEPGSTPQAWSWGTIDWSLFPTNVKLISAWKSGYAYPVTASSIRWRSGATKNSGEGTILATLTQAAPIVAQTPISKTTTIANPNTANRSLKQEVVGAASQTGGFHIVLGV